MQINHQGLITNLRTLEPPLLQPNLPSYFFPSHSSFPLSSNFTTTGPGELKKLSWPFLLFIIYYLLFIIYYLFIISYFLFSNSPLAPQPSSFHQKRRTLLLPSLPSGQLHSHPTYNSILHVMEQRTIHHLQTNHTQSIIISNNYHHQIIKTTSSHCLYVLVLCLVLGYTRLLKAIAFISPSPEEG